MDGLFWVVIYIIFLKNTIYKSDITRCSNFALCGVTCAADYGIEMHVEILNNINKNPDILNKGFIFGLEGFDYKDQPDDKQKRMFVCEMTGVIRIDIMKYTIYHQHESMNIYNIVIPYIYNINKFTTVMFHGGQQKGNVDLATSITN